MAEITGYDHTAIPLEHESEMAEFYRALGFVVEENPYLITATIGQQRINMHRKALWQRESFTLRGPTALPGCGDFCFNWTGTPQEAIDLVNLLGAPLVEGPVDRVGGRNATGSSVYTRDPDGNLVEFISYGSQG